MVFKVVPVSQSSKRFLSVLYGPPGSGKTYGSSTLSGNTLVIDFDRGTSAIPAKSDVAVYQPDDYVTLISDMKDIADSAYDNIVFDTLTELQNLLVEAYTPPITQKDWGVIAGKLNKVISWLDKMSTMGKNVIVLCQEKILDEDDPKKMLSTVELLPSVRNKLTPAARVIGRTYINSDGEFSIALKSHPKRITKVSIFGFDTDEVKSFKELIEKLEEN